MAEIPLMAGKSVLVTGGTGGIGMATAAALAALGARVGITGRDQARAAAAAAGIRTATGDLAARVPVRAGCSGPLGGGLGWARATFGPDCGGIGL